MYTIFILNVVKDFENENNNKILLRNIISIKSRNNISSPFKFNKNFISINKKYEMMNIVKDNLRLYKKLNRSYSEYDCKKLEKEYKTNQYYKRNHSRFPSIESINKSKLSLYNQKRYLDYFKEIKYFKNNPLNSNLNHSQIIKENYGYNKNKVPLLFYKTTTYLDVIGKTKVYFYIKYNKYSIYIIYIIDSILNSKQII